MSPCNQMLEGMANVMQRMSSERNGAARLPFQRPVANRRHDPRPPCHQIQVNRIRYSMHTLSAIALRDKFLKANFPPSEIVKTFLDRIENLDSQIGAFLSVFPESALAKLKNSMKSAKTATPLASSPPFPSPSKTTCTSKEKSPLAHPNFYQL